MSLLLVVPVTLNALAVALLGFGAYPRSFLYVLPLGMVLVVRGVNVLAVSSATRRTSVHANSGHRLTAVLLTLMLVVSAASLVHLYRYPKQDYTGALQHVRQHASPGDVTCAVGWAGSAYESYYDPELKFPESLDELRALEQAGRDVWVIYSFTRDMRRFLPEMFDHIQERLTLEAIYPGTLGDGDLFVARWHGRTGVG